MDVGILGCGAEGGLFAGYLSKDDHDVRAYDVDEELVTAINRDGIRVERNGKPDFTAAVEASSDPAVLNGADLVFVFVRAHQTRDAMASIAEAIDGDMKFVTLQNGFRNHEIISEFIDTQNVFGGYTEIGADYRYNDDDSIIPGAVAQYSGGATGIGGHDEAFSDTIVAMLSNAGIKASRVDDFRASIWNKQLVSVAIKPIAGLCELKNGDMTRCVETRNLMKKLIEEAIAVFEAEGVPVYYDDPVENTLEICDRTGDKKSSILTDVENKRPSEIGEINGFIVEHGQKLGVSTPHHEIVWNLVMGKEFGYEPAKASEKIK